MLPLLHGATQYASGRDSKIGFGGRITGEKRQDMVPEVDSFSFTAHFVYILQSETTSHFYIGHPDNITRRLARHNNPDYHGTKHTKRHKGPWGCMCTEQYSTCGEVQIREREIKSKKSGTYVEHLVGSRQRVEDKRIKS